MKAFTPHIVLCAGILLLAGCVSTSKTVYVDEAKMSVTFASPQAERLFYDGMAKNRAQLANANRTQERTHVSLILINVSRNEVTSGPNHNFNQAVLLCDTDRDGVITEKEAELFANSGNRDARPLPATAPAARS